LSFILFIFALYLNFLIIYKNMSKMIIEKISGSLLVKNIDNGAVFTIEIPV